jgi:hypothetical protein
MGGSVPPACAGAGDLAHAEHEEAVGEAGADGKPCRQADLGEGAGGAGSVAPAGKEAGVEAEQVGLLADGGLQVAGGVPESGAQGPEVEVAVGGEVLGAGVLPDLAGAVVGVDGQDAAAGADGAGAQVGCDAGAGQLAAARGPPPLLTVRAGALRLMAMLTPTVEPPWKAAPSALMANPRALIWAVPARRTLSWVVPGAMAA